MLQDNLSNFFPQGKTQEGKSESEYFGSPNAKGDN